MSDYSASAIEVLEGLEPVRKRPGMYIGTTDSRGLNHLIWEVVDNSVDEALAGHAHNIDIHLRADGAIEVSDDGRGIPTDVNAKTGLPGPVLVFTKLHAGGKFGGESSGYKVSGGLHGVGASVVNALSERLDVEVCRDGTLHAISFQRGEPGHFDGDGAFTPATDMAVSKAPKGRKTGTTVRYWPDLPLFHSDARISPDKVRERAHTTSYLVPGLTLTVTDELSDERSVDSYRNDGGSADFVEYLATGESVSPVLTFAGTDTYTETTREDEQTVDVERTIEIDASMVWTSGYDTNIRSFANIVATPKGGKHVEGFEAAVAKAIRDAIDEQSITTKKEQNDDKYAISKDDTLEGVTAVVMVRLPEPQFEGQTKEVLGTPEARSAVYHTVKSQLTEWLAAKKNRTQARAVLKKAADAMRARLAARAQRETVRRKQALESSTLPAKLADCRTHDLEKSEIFLVEGDSAMGSAKSARDSEYQALLPLRGKILNTVKANEKRMLENAECSAIITALGAGSGASFTPDALRYGKVILLMDADVDGAHIRALLLALFHEYLRPLLEEGRVFSAQPPLYKVEEAGSGGKKGDVHYCYDDAAKDKLLRKLEKAGTKVKSLQRYKGLGEMNADQLADTTMERDKRILRRITLEDAERAAEVFQTTMGTKVEPRREFIEAASQKIDRAKLDV